MMSVSLSTRMGRRCPVRRSERGFTLVELIVVIVIGIVMLAVAVPSYVAVQDHQRDQAVQSALQTVNDRLNMAKATRSSDDVTWGEIADGRAVWSEDMIDTVRVGGEEIRPDITLHAVDGGDSTRFSQVTYWWIDGSIGDRRWSIDRDGRIFGG